MESRPIDLGFVPSNTPTTIQVEDVGRIVIVNLGVLIARGIWEFILPPSSLS